MQAVISSPHIIISRSLKTHIFDRLKRLDLRYGDHISDVKVSLFDIEGSRGSVDTVCHFQAHLERHPIINTEGRSTDPYIAVLLAAHRMERAVGSMLGMPATRSGTSRSNARTRKPITGPGHEPENRQP